ncbi:hypothetical protein HYQ43_04495 [Paracoccus pantotrophus]|uniref:Uncharacterized protein n=1 Tax=Paracoccus pantotrophus TaxID=82367 RepID=A0A7H9BRT0_PARPN|nr:hypothetical protein [Paracoccus pantotrophus]QLH13545.1 hypothetical protein HYQ43_04495 [Paracoccus pantotrophus]
MTAPHTSTEAGGPATALPSTEYLALLEKAIPAGPWLSVQNHPTNACAHVLQDAAYAIEIATLYGGHDDVPAPSDGEPWADMPTRDATAEAIALLPALLREVLDRRAAEAGMRALLRAGCDLLAIESEALRDGISVNGVMCPCPEDQATVEAIREMEDWIASVKATLYPTTPTTEASHEE